MNNEDDDPRDYASSPCMMHEVENDGSVAQIIYLRIEESSAGFRWQACAHDLLEPIEVGSRLFSLESEALSEGRLALERLCDQFRRNQPLK